MIQTPTQCPPETELIDYLLGKLPEDQWPLLETHFQDCRACEETMRGLSASDTLSQFAGQAAASVDSGPKDDLPFVSGLIERLQRTTCDRTRDPSMLRDRANEVIQLLDDPQQPDSLGELGEYRIEELIGAGSTGVVFRAVDRQLGRRVALKVLRPSLGDGARRRFMAEARAAASIEHPNVITIWQVGQHNALAFIAMQWLPGETLEDRHARVTVVSEDEVRDIALQVAAGLRAAHERTLIHRDIKPANIWLCEASDQAIILDFGLARIADDDPHMTSTGMLAGTPNFMSPEQTRGQELDGRSDLFSLGCLMYRAATGKLPFGAGGVLATLQSIQHHQPPLPRELNPNLSPDFSDLIMCLLEKQPANRPANANDLIHAFGHAREGWPFAATRYSSPPTIAPITVQPQPTSGSRSRRWIIAATLATLLAAGAYAFGQQIIRFATNRGEIVIETDDENVQVEILSGGEIVKIVDTSTQQRIDIQAGEYEITARDPNNANGEFKISNKHIVLTRGGRQIVSVQLIDGGNEKKSATVAPKLVDRGNENKFAKVPPVENMYEGRTFDDWVLELSRERSRAAVETGFAALGELSRGDAMKQERAIEIARPLIRIHGNVTIMSGWPDVFNKFLSYFPAERVVQFAIDEITHGTSQSRSQSIRLLNVDTIYDGRETLQTEHRAAIRENLNRIVDAGCDYLENDRSGTDNGTIKRLMSEAIETSFSAASSDGQSAYEEVVEKNIPHLVNRLTTSTDSETRKFLATVLVSSYANYVDVVSNAFFNVLGETDLSSELTGIIYFKHLTTTSDFVSFQTVPSLIRTFESNALCDRVLEYLGNNQTAIHQLRGHSGGRGGISAEGGASGRDPADILDSDPERTIAPDSDSRFPSGRDAVRADILFAIGNKLHSAAKYQLWLDEEAANDSPKKQQFAIEAASQRETTSAALSWLHKIAAGESTLKQHAATAAKKVRGKRLDPAETEAGGGNDGVDNEGRDATENAEIERVSKSDSKLTYEGRTFTQWQELLKTERRFETLQMALNGLGVLSAGNPELQETAIEIVRPMFRSPDDQFAKPLTGDPTTSARTMHDVFDQFFSYLPPERVVKFAVNEISEGTIHSRKRLRTLLTDTGVHSNPELRQRFKQAVKEHTDEIVGAVFDIAQRHPEELPYASNILQGSLGAAYFKHVPNADGRYLYVSELPKSMISRLEKEMASTSNDRWAGELCRQLLEFEIFSAAVKETLAEQLANPAFNLSNIYFNVFPDLAKSHAAEMVDSLIAIYKSDELTGRLTGEQRSRDFIRADIINRIADFGAAGATALPWLDEIAAGDSLQASSFAAEAADKIRVAVEDGKKTTTDKER